MDNHILRLLQLLENEDDGEDIQALPVRFPRYPRQRNNPFEDPTVSDAVFESRYRFSRGVLLIILQHIEVLLLDVSWLILVP